MEMSNKTTVNFYEGSYQFDSVTTNLHVSPDFIEMKLAKQYEYRPTIESLWAIMKTNDEVEQRFELIFGKGLLTI